MSICVNIYIYIFQSMPIIDRRVGLVHVSCETVLLQQIFSFGGLFFVDNVGGSELSSLLVVYLL